MYPVSVDWGGGSIFLVIFGGLFIYMVVRIVWILRKKYRVKKDVVDVVVLAVVVLVMGGLVFGINGFNSIALKDGELEVRFLTGFKKVEITAEEISEARILDWTEEPEYRPARRTMGTAIGAFREGRFTLENGEKAYLLTNSSRVVFLDTAEGWFLLGPDDLDGFYAEINQQMNGSD